MNSFDLDKFKYMRCKKQRKGALIPLRQLFSLCEFDFGNRRLTVHVWMLKSVCVLCALLSCVNCAGPVAFCGKEGKIIIITGSYIALF